MRVTKDEVVVSMDRGEVQQIADDLNTIVNHLAKLFADAGDIDVGHPLDALNSAAHRVDAVRMQLEKVRYGG